MTISSVKIINRRWSRCVCSPVTETIASLRSFNKTVRISLSLAGVFDCVNVLSNSSSWLINFYQSDHLETPHSPLQRVIPLCMFVSLSIIIFNSVKSPVCSRMVLVSWVNQLCISAHKMSDGFTSSFLWFLQHQTSSHTCTRLIFVDIVCLCDRSSVCVCVFCSR